MAFTFLSQVRCLEILGDGLVDRWLIHCLAKWHLHVKGMVSPRGCTGVQWATG